MTPEEEAALLKLVAELQAKITSIESDEVDKENKEVDGLKKEMAGLSGEKLDSFVDWSKKELTRSIAVFKKNNKDDPAEPTEDQLIPKLDSKGKSIPWIQRINWTKASYPEWK